MTREELISEIAKGRKVFPKEDFSGEDLSGLDLPGMDFRRSNFKGVPVKNSNLTGCIMVLCDIEGANFEGSTIDDVNWEQVKNADAATFKGAIYEGQALESNVTVDTLGKYQRLVSDKFIQIGCMKGNPTFWKTLDSVKLAAEVEKINPSEKADAEAWRVAHLAKTVTDHEAKKPIKPKDEK